jgi:hypothetical protein
VSILSDKQAIEAAVKEYRDRLDAIPDNLFNITPPGGGWSYGEVYSHILQANLGSVIAVEKCGNGTGKADHKRLSLLAWLILLSGRFPGKVKAPEKVAAMTTNMSKEEARNMLVKFKRRFDQVTPSVKGASKHCKIKHPRLGMLNAEQWLRFIDIHTRHHLKQLNRIDKKFLQG